MPCNHKFQEDLTLERLDFEPNTLIVGTFNPAWPDNNQAQWFYGRTHDQHGNRNNNFWDVLPRVYGENSLINAGPVEWKAFCKNHKIALTDLISCVEDANQPEHNNAMGGYADGVIANDFQRHTFNDIVKILRANPSIKNVYLTRGNAATFWARLWRPVRIYCVQNKLRENTLLTPSGYAFYQHGRYNNLNVNNPIANLEDFILMRWHGKWHGNNF
jgi:hypothetical protein